MFLSDIASFHLYRRIRISKIISDQDSEQINSDLSGNICSKENRLSKIIPYRSDQDSEQINSDLLVAFVKKKTDYLISIFIDLTKILNRSNLDLSGNICSKENRLSKITLYRSDQDSEQINSDLSGNICSKENRLSKINLYRSDQDSEQINSDLSGNIC